MYRRFKCHLYRPLRDVGLVNNHAYSILDVREVSGVLPGVQTNLADFSNWMLLKNVCYNSRCRDFSSKKLVKLRFLITIVAL